jgi:hypothetical protein
MNVKFKYVYDYLPLWETNREQCTGLFVKSRYNPTFDETNKVEMKGQQRGIQENLNLGLVVKSSSYSAKLRQWLNKDKN